MKRLCILIFLFLCVAAFPTKARESLLWPVEGYYNISSGYGVRTSGIHRGIDINSYGGAGSISGKAVLAARSGTVCAVGNSCTHNYAKTTSCGCGGGYGNFVYVQHDDDGTVARYAHLASVSVSYGQRVTRGETLGTVGSTGSSGGFHLHFELRNADGNTVNPMPSNTDGRHTYYGSSAPHSEWIAYIYDTAVLGASLSSGGISVTLNEAAENAQILVAQYKDGALISLSAGAASSAFEIVEGAENAKVMLWEGIMPASKAVYLQL